MHSFSAICTALRGLLLSQPVLTRESEAEEPSAKQGVSEKQEKEEEVQSSSGRACMSERVSK